jgi:mevalonate pyrophosphate decarboxylase
MFRKNLIFAIKMVDHPEIVEVTCISPINIALVKYWGKTDQDLIIPANDSFSMTVSKK